MFKKTIEKALGEISERHSEGFKFKDMPFGLKFWYRFLIFTEYVKCPKMLWQRFKIWNFYRKHPYLKDKK